MRASTEALASSNTRCMSQLRRSRHLIRGWERGDGFFDFDIAAARSLAATDAAQEEASMCFGVRHRAFCVYRKHCALCVQLSCDQQNRPKGLPVERQSARTFGVSHNVPFQSLCFAPDISCRFAEIAIGIIVGCIPSVHKYFRHISKNGSSFNLLRIPYSGSSETRGPLYWRKLFARSTSSGVGATHPRKLSGSTIAGNSGSSAVPHIKTLNMTCASFSLAEEEKTNALSSLSVPAPVHVHVHVQQKEETEGSTSINDETYEGVEDVESGRGVGTWRQNDDMQRKNGGRNNETMRAHYEIHSRE